jgi:hypothetical protein
MKISERIENAILKMAEQIKVNRVEAPVTKLEDVALTDGQVLNVEKMEVNSPASLVGADGIPVPADGEFETADGTKIVCVAGVITEIKPKDAPVDAPTADPNAEMKTALEALTNEVKTLKANFSSQTKESDKVKAFEIKLSEMTQAHGETLNIVKDLNDLVTKTSVAISLEAEKTPKKVKTYEEMTKREQMEYNRNNK